MKVLNEDSKGANNGSNYDQLQLLKELTLFHQENCWNFKKILELFHISTKEIHTLQDLPYLPVAIFKDHKMVSVNEEKIVRTLTSSGTSGQSVSKIYLDKETATAQVRVLAKLLEPFLGSARLPMLVLDSESIVKRGEIFSARAAGILGFSIFASSVTYALDSEMNPNFQQVEEFVNKYVDQPVLLYGFTFIAWKQFMEKANSEKRLFPLKRSVFIHGGGWKKLQDEALSAEDFKNYAKAIFQTEKVVNYYGMAEQTGSIFLECGEGYFHSTTYNNVLVRSFQTLEPVKYGEEGFLQTLSTIPRSYPGYSLLTEDVGIVYGVDDCICGQTGTYFLVKGRIPQAEVRGCSDTFEQIK